jgi:two-component system invasion response regulator UvrY
MRFLLLDSQTMMLSGIKSLIKQEFPNAICDTLQSAEQLIEMTEKNQYSLVVTELNMPGVNMIALIELLIAKMPTQKILIYTSYPDYLYARRLLQMGTKGFVNKSQPTNSFLLALHNVINGQYYLSNQLVEKNLLGYIPKPGVNPFERLTNREKEVCFLIMKGYRLREMADMMHLQKSTVGTHQSRILGKLGLQKPFEIRELAAAYSIPIYE